MLFGTQIGFVQGTMPQGQAMCPPDPVWNYFPSPFEPLTYFGPKAAPTSLPSPPPPAPIYIDPPKRPGWDPVPEPASTLPPRPATTPMPVPVIPQSPGRGAPAVMPGPSMTPMPPQMPIGYEPRRGAFIPYANETKLNGLGAPGPFGMSWAGFLGVMAVAVGGGVGLGYLYNRRG